jgi:hydroxyacylglutathione hydrolase
MIIKQHVSNSVFQENTYIISKNDQVVIIDPGDDLTYLSDYIDNDKHKVLAVLATHAHLDHIFGASDLCKEYSCPFVLSSKDLEILNAHENSCEYFKQKYRGTPSLDLDISNKSILHLGAFKIKILHTPGHSPGGVCYLIDDVLFSGDTLFHRSVGRTDLHGGDHGTLIRSIKEVLFTLPEETIVYPGHMGLTTIGEEKLHNPFIIL